ncbi:MAG: phage holin family protein [Burkholderia sp.]
MTTNTPPPHPAQAPLRRLLGSVFALLQTRLELLGIELAEEKERLLGVLFLGLAAMMLAAMALISLTVLVVIVSWDSYRWQSLAAITAFYAIGSLGCSLKARASLREVSSVFEATLHELEKDRELFRSKP